MDFGMALYHQGRNVKMRLIKDFYFMHQPIRGKTHFWSDERIKGIIFWFVFARINALAINKVVTLNEFGRWENNVYINLRRDCLIENLMNELNCLIWGNVNMVELLTIGEAFLLFVVSNWKDKYDLVIESDSMNIVRWISKPCEASWRFQYIVMQIEKLKSKMNRWQLVHHLRSGNEISNNLAKEGVNRDRDFFMINPF
ncbi:Uncharacterized protein TCM_040570 [Theobroma cacao]|uniref:RNase H type-1 domain-containing protein n=1 Tax=Theobroma cacao TaxID=3641 RepID=A0A061GRV4_THECC|nr:Uncharacterized protein TCM_040570 [Theobroma cacao]